MIGVAAAGTDLEVAEEFFELFKTPWEPVVDGRKYRVVLSTDGRSDAFDTELLLAYGSDEQELDRKAGARVCQVAGLADIEWGGQRFPMYGRAARFENVTGAGMVTSAGEAIDYRKACGSRVVRRIGYDLFAETRHLLGKGQPARHALIPTLELHIDLLRSLLRESGIPFVEIPPRPDGYDFTCCLTHDLDFFGIRRHTLDLTLAGFIGRASVGTLVDCLRGRRPATDVVRNWLALCSLPLVFLRLAPDFWRPVADYLRVEGGRRSTFFVIPFKGRPGVSPDNTAMPHRAVRYQASEVRGELSRAVSAGSEIAVHGIDAWRHADAGREEMAQFDGLTRRDRPGIRMHWLFFSDDSAKQLENAGFGYDSSWGYNDAVGYRPGTSQAFRLQGTETLMELPLTIMDSALFFRRRMNLPPQEALHLCFRIVADARRFGGTVVVNWHDRSLAPERLWGQSYKALLTEVTKGDRAWVATAGEAVDWFRWRRSIKFQVETSGQVTVAARVRDPALPAARLCIHKPGGAGAGTVQEIPFPGDDPLTLHV